MIGEISRNSYKTCMARSAGSPRISCAKGEQHVQGCLMQLMESERERGAYFGTTAFGGPQFFIMYDLP